MSKPLRLPNCDEQAFLDQVQARLVERTELERFKQLLDEHHYLVPRHVDSWQRGGYNDELFCGNWRVGHGVI